MEVPAVEFPLHTLIRLIGFTVAGLLIILTFHYRGGIGLSGALLFNVHPLLSVIGLVLLHGEALLAYKTLGGTKNFKKLAHLSLQLFNLCLGLVGLWAVWKVHVDKGSDNFYSLHSWLGLACLILFTAQVFSGFGFGNRVQNPKLLGGFRLIFSLGQFLLCGSDMNLVFNSVFGWCMQWAAGFVTFWYPGGAKSSREFLLPWHVFFGVYIYALSIVATVTGILKRATSLQNKQIITHYSTEALLLNTTGILIMALGGLVVLALVTRNYRV